MKTHTEMELLENEVISGKVRRLESVRKTLGINKSELARRIDSPQSHISRVLKGDAPLGDLLSDKIVRRLHINPIWWETGEGTMFITAEDGTETKPLAYAEQIRLETENRMLREQIDLLTKLLQSKPEA